MKIAITGTSRGIGKGISEVLAATGHEVKGFNRSEGYDINNPRKIVDAVRDYDVFINNAWQDFHQCNLFSLIINEWRMDPSKTVVNINSRTVYGIGIDKKYTMAKKQLQKMSWNSINDLERKCRLISLYPGFVDTDMTVAYKDDFNMMSPKEFGEIVKWCIEQPQHIEIGELACWIAPIKE